MKTLSIDLNCDLGEGCGNDADLMQFISSANIACGYHAGDTPTMQRTIELALEHGVAIGAHPGYADRKNFGRVEMHLSPTEIYRLVTDQISALKLVATGFGRSLDHVKPHGALYNQAAKDAEIATAIAEAVRDADPQLVLFGLAGSKYLDVARATGLCVASEVFADRTYMPDGSLTPRTEVGALIEDARVAVDQALQMVKIGSVTARDGASVPIRAETICLHGDGPHAVEFAQAITTGLRKNGINIASIKNEHNGK